MREKELRLALICYGGVSLAIYMHGITREIWHLCRASRNFHDATPINEGSQAIYRLLLHDIEQESGIAMRILTDIVAGSSAGGINGIFLSQAITTGQSLEPLTDLWLSNADVEKLLDPDARPFSRFTKFWATPIAWLLLRRRGGAVQQNVAKEARDEVAGKLSSFVRARWFAPPFGGMEFSSLLLDAFQAMENGPKGPSLLPPAQPLDLFVTATDFYGYKTTLNLNSPAKVSENEHRLTIRFSTVAQLNADDAENDHHLHLGHHAELVFAARATASFPGAFPPMTVREIDNLSTKHKLSWPNRDNFLARILPEYSSNNNLENAILVDGSILANAPFMQAIGALRNRPARREVDRRFVYIDPKPGIASFRPKINRTDADELAQHGHPSTGPGWFATIFGASSNIPREQPIRDSLELINGRSDRIMRMKDITDNLQHEVEQYVEQMVGRNLFINRPTAARLTKWRLKTQDQSAKLAGISYPTYGHLKLAGIVDDMISLARRILPSATEDHFQSLRSAIWTYLKENGMSSVSGKSGGASKEIIEFFIQHDLRYRIRRMRFMARKLSDEVEAKSTATSPNIEQMHDVIYHILALYLDRETANFHGPDMAKIVQNGPENPHAFLSALMQKRDLQSTDILADEMICEGIANLEDEQRRAMMFGYLGYPLYDIATLPLLQGEGLDEFDPIKVDRISPDDAVAIEPGGTIATLKGIEFNNFGAFFSRTYRENDYLWGRLHGADRLIDIVCSTLPQNARPNASKILFYKYDAFIGILDQEQKRLSNIRPKMAEIRAKVEKMRAELPID
ncbi:patatin [Sphingorhabdus lutea]|uniref:Patatin n=1 Tax=Sphingorhabdus lutea TaxID=1913578 RepID=A0A1L3JF85_9SPHN|nr:patatin-like protein [Sphingorhabdus lutea]APG63780.1 patatin [Sphingorhabdus lutea]